DSTQLNNALNTDPRGTARLFLNSTQGFAARLADMARQMAAPGGLVSTETGAIQNDVSRVQDRIAGEQHNLDVKRQSLRKQYTALDSLMGTMKTTQSFLTKQLASLPA
ncbi:MAG TPA: flagellar filament capping protein FliD, partial [Gammaproteobacteria bacterium]|nr:flagellar filament capping protein FliD [Gammaproteobacteria bacterium]